MHATSHAYMYICTSNHKSKNLRQETFIFYVDWRTILNIIFLSRLSHSPYLIACFHRAFMLVFILKRKRRYLTYSLSTFFSYLQPIIVPSHLKQKPRYRNIWCFINHQEGIIPFLHWPSVSSARLLNFAKVSWIRNSTVWMKRQIPQQLQPVFSLKFLW